jgi:hypothetical protein
MPSHNLFAAIVIIITFQTRKTGLKVHSLPVLVSRKSERVILKQGILDFCCTLFLQILVIVNAERSDLQALSSTET